MRSMAMALVDTEISCAAKGYRSLRVDQDSANPITKTPLANGMLARFVQAQSIFRAVEPRAQ